MPENPLINLAGQNAMEPQPAKGPSSNARSEREMRLLVVDDLANMRRTLRNMLRYLGFENIVEADDGDTGLEKLEESPIDFVIADWVMPRIAGIDMLRAARERPHLRDIPFLMITAEVEAGQIVQAAETDVDGYIIKPFVAKTLEEKILGIIHRKKNPSALQKLFSAAEEAKTRENYDQAIKIFEKIKEVNPRSARARQAMGSIFEIQGDLDKAEAFYQEAAAVNPQFIKVHQSLGDLYVKKGEPEKAVMALESAVHISPNNPDRLMKLGQAYLESGDPEGADEVFKSAVKQDSMNADRRTAIGELFLKAGQEERAAETFRDSLHLKEDINVYNRLGIALRRKGKFKEAIKEYKRAIKVDPNDEVLYYNIGRAFMQDRNFKSARKAFGKALAVDSGFEDAKKMLKKLDEKGY